MTRDQLYDLWRTRVDECGGVRPALRKYGGIRRTTLQNLLHWGGDKNGWMPREGHAVKKETVHLDHDGNILQRWIEARDEGDTGNLIEALQDAFAAYDGKAGVIPPPVTVDGDLLTVYPLPDMHFGMLSWERETGQAYDMDIAERMALESVSHLVSQSRPSERAVVLALGDYFHSNDHKGVTPAHGHRLDVDGRWQKVFERGAALAVHIVDLVARKHGHVDVVFLPGNHDPDAAACLTVALALFYSRDERITVHTDPGIAWYQRFGLNLLGATHGHTIRSADRLAMMMATDRPREWGETRYRHMMVGHLHHDIVKGVGPVVVETFTTPAARDAHAAAGGYRSNRALHALTYHRDRGPIGRHTINIH